MDRKSIEQSCYKHLLKDTKNEIEFNDFAEAKLCKVNEFAYWEKADWIGRYILLTGWCIWLYAGKGYGYEVEDQHHNKEILSSQCLTLVENEAEIDRVLDVFVYHPEVEL